MIHHLHLQRVMSLRRDMGKTQRKKVKMEREKEGQTRRGRSQDRTCFLCTKGDVLCMKRYPKVKEENRYQCRKKFLGGYTSFFPLG